MIRIAIPVFQDRISPVLDACTRLLIVDLDKNVEIERKEIYLDDFSLAERLTILKKMKVAVVICCGISEVFHTLLRSIGIQLNCGIVGEVDKILKAYLCDRLDDPRFFMPVCQLNGKPAKRESIN